MTPKRFYLGDRVTDRHGRTGRVSRIWPDFAACAAACLSPEMDGAAWLAAQRTPFAPGDTVGLWATVALHDGKGAALSPVALLEHDFR